MPKLKQVMSFNPIVHKRRPFRVYVDVIVPLIGISRYTASIEDPVREPGPIPTLSVLSDRGDEAIAGYGVDGVIRRVLITRPEDLQPYYRTESTPVSCWGYGGTNGGYWV